MCGEIQEWQFASQVFLRLTGDGRPQQITLQAPFERVEEIRLDEAMATTFNGGASGMGYLTISGGALTSGTLNSDRRTGVLLMFDVNNPHMTFSRPRVVAKATQATVHQFEISFLSPTGTALTFGELGLCLTFVCRKSEDELAEVRRLKASIIQESPSVKEAALRTTYDPYDPANRAFFRNK